MTTASKILDRVLVLEMVRVTEAAAIAAARSSTDISGVTSVCVWSDRSIPHPLNRFRPIIPKNLLQTINNLNNP